MPDMIELECRGDGNHFHAVQNLPNEDYDSS
jgi:hypothetical protein